MTRGQPARRTGLRAVRPTAQLLRDTSEGITSEYTVRSTVKFLLKKPNTLSSALLSSNGNGLLLEVTASRVFSRVGCAPPTCRTRRPGSGGSVWPGVLLGRGLFSPLVSKIQVLLKHGPRGLVSLSPVCDSPVSLALLIPSHSLQMLALSSQEPPLCAPALPVDCSLPAQHAAAWPPGPCPNVAQAFPPHHAGHQLTGCHTLDASLAAAV